MRNWISTKGNNCVLRGMIYSICGLKTKTSFQKEKIAAGATQTIEIYFIFFSFFLFWFEACNQKIEFIEKYERKHDLFARVGCMECLMPYGSCHVQGKALFMDYSISRR